MKEPASSLVEGPRVLESAGENASTAPYLISTEDRQLLARLRSRDETAFTTLVNRHHAAMARLARLYVPNSAVAEEVVQETWVGVLQGLERFEERCSLKTWLFSILMNRARTRGQRESRMVPVGSAIDFEAGPPEAAVSGERFLPADHHKWPGHWAQPPQSWGENPEKSLLAAESLKFIRRAIEALPKGQREVITLRDVEQWSSEEVCNVLGISETNQRVLLHRARSRVRGALEQYMSARKACQGAQ